MIKEDLKKVDVLRNNQTHPPVSLWNSSSFKDWLASLLLMDRKMYPPMNSWTTLQSAERQLKMTHLSSSNDVIMCLVSQLMFHAWKINQMFENGLFIFRPVYNTIPSLYCISTSWCDLRHLNSYAWSCWQQRRGAHLSFLREIWPQTEKHRSLAKTAKLW